LEEAPNTLTLESVLDIIEPKPCYYLFFLANDKSRNVKVKETEEIDLNKIMVHLVRRESVFITPKLKPKLNLPKPKTRKARMLSGGKNAA
jgi:hypothetical protein